MNFKTLALVAAAATGIVIGAAPQGAKAATDMGEVCRVNVGTAAQIVNEVNSVRGLYVTNMGHAVGDSTPWTDTYYNGYNKIAGCMAPMTTNQGRAYLRYTVEVDHNGRYWVGTAGFTPSWSFQF